MIRATRTQWIKFAVVLALYDISCLVEKLAGIGGCTVYLRCVYHKEDSMDLVERVQEPSCSDCHGMGGCYCIRTGGGILCQPLFLPELCDSFFFAGKIIADG